MPESVRLALIAFRQERLNCAQSVLRGFQLLHNVPEEQIAQAKALGGGRAAEGRCGALHAAMQLAHESSLLQDLIAAFLAKAGSEHCKQIRAMKKVSCAQCVELAARILDQHHRRFEANESQPLQG
jgi:hypothetical protein